MINYELDGRTYELNLIDTPGHVDFHYEVSRSLAACEGAILLVDATQGVQAQTVANASAAINADLVIVPALNKIDMQASRPEEVKDEIEHTLGISLPPGLMSNLELMIFGALIIFFLIVEPHGLARLWQIAKEKLRLWPFPH